MCSICDFKKYHNGHKLISIEDEESLKKENINLDSSINELNEMIQTIINLKNKIENEINQINKLYDTKK